MRVDTHSDVTGLQHLELLAIERAVGTYHYALRAEIERRNALEGDPGAVTNGRDAKSLAARPAHVLDGAPAYPSEHLSVTEIMARDG